MKPRQWMLIALVAGASAAPLVAADRYKVDPEHTYPSLEFDHLGLSIWRGKFNKTAGSIVLDRAAETGSAEIRVDTASIDFGHDRMNEFARAADWLNVDMFPVMTYKGAIRFADGRPASLDGHLTLLGVTKPLTLTIKRFKCMPHPLFRREVCGADVEGEVNRVEFGMTQYPQGGRLQLRIQVEALKED